MKKTYLFKYSIGNTKEAQDKSEKKIDETLNVLNSDKEEAIMIEPVLEVIPAETDTKFTESESNPTKLELIQNEIDVILTEPETIPTEPEVIPTEPKPLPTEPEVIPAETDTLIAEPVIEAIKVETAVEDNDLIEPAVKAESAEPETDGIQPENVSIEPVLDAHVAEPVVEAITQSVIDNPESVEPEILNQSASISIETLSEKKDYETVDEYLKKKRIFVLFALNFLLYYCL